MDRVLSLCGDPEHRREAQSSPTVRDLNGSSGADSGGNRQVAQGEMVGRDSVQSGEGNLMVEARRLEARVRGQVQGLLSSLEETSECLRLVCRQVETRVVYDANLPMLVVSGTASPWNTTLDILADQLTTKGNMCTSLASFLLRRMVLQAVWRRGALSEASPITFCFETYKWVGTTQISAMSERRLFQTGNTECSCRSRVQQGFESGRPKVFLIFIGFVKALSAALLRAGRTA